MMTNKRREELLNDKGRLYLDEEEDCGEIEMTNLQGKNNNGPNYKKLQDSANFSGHFYHKHETTKINPKHQVEQKTYSDKPLVPITSYNFEPNLIQLNGIAFVHKNAIRGVIKTEQKTKQPEMEVTCQACATPQTVPANTNSFICFDCECVQVCVPQYGIFICGRCQKKVWYPLGTSDLIKCGKCWTINKIPSQQDYLPKQNPYLYEHKGYEKRNEQRNEEEKFYTKRYPM